MDSEFATSVADARHYPQSSTDWTNLRVKEIISITKHRGNMSAERVLSLLVPTYNGAATITETLQNLTAQKLPAEWTLEIVVSDDCSSDETQSLVRRFPDSRVRIWCNDINLGYPGNLNRALSRSTGEIVVLFGQDDLMAKDYLLKVIDLFQADDSIGAITRPYFAFDRDIRKPVRYKKLPTSWSLSPSTFCMESNSEDLRLVFSTLDQLSGLAFRRSEIRVPFHDDVFPCHVYPFAEILSRKSVAVIPIYAVAVRTWTSQCRHTSWIYNKSPVQSWIDLFEAIFGSSSHKHFRDYMIRSFCAYNSVGLLQIRNYSTRPVRYTMREIAIMISRRPKNLLSPTFLLIVAICALTPPPLLRRIVDVFKRRVSSKTVPPITFVPSGF